MDLFIYSAGNTIVYKILTVDFVVDIAVLVWYNHERIKGFSTVIENKRWPTSFSLYLIYTSLQILHSVVVDQDRDQETEIKQSKSVRTRRRIQHG